MAIKNGMQIIISTHNKKDGNEVRYHSGAIESPEINSALLDVLRAQSQRLITGARSI